MFIIDELKGHPDTENLAKALKAKYKDHVIHAYPDPSGKSRKTSAPVGQTDFTILERAGIKVHAKNKAPTLVDSVNDVNAMLMNAAGETNMYVSHTCEGTITSLERTVWTENNPDTAVIDKSEGIEHFSDGIRYGTNYLFPIKRSAANAARGFGF